MALIIIIIFKIYLLTNIITIPMRNKRTSTFSASTFRVHECACVIKFHLGKWRPIRDPIFVVAETVFFHSICRYHLNTCRPEFYYKCDWNGARIIVIFQQTKKMICLKKTIIYIYNYDDFASFATRRFSTLTTIFGHLEDVASHKNTRYE